MKREAESEPSPREVHVRNGGQEGKGKAITVMRSIVSVEALAVALADAYGFADVRCRLIKAMMSDTYHVLTAREPYVLRIYRHGARTRPEIEAELDFLAYLQDRGLHVSVAVRQPGGERVMTLGMPEGRRYAVLFTRAEGRTLGEARDARAARNYGTALARLHVLADEMPMNLTRPHLDLSTLLDRPLAALADVLEDRRGAVEDLRHGADVLRKRVEALSTDTPTYGMCHGDVDSSNVLVAGDGRVTLIDFEFCGPGWRAFDVACFLSGARFGGAVGEIPKAFVAGYQDIRPLDRYELRALRVFEAVRTIWSLGIFALNVNEWGSYRITDAFMDRTSADVQRLVASVEAD